MDFRAIVSNDRIELCSADVLPGNLEFPPMPTTETPAHLVVDERVYVAGVTRGSAVGIEGLEAIIEGLPACVGLIGSKNRWAAARQGLIDQAWGQSRKNRSDQVTHWIEYQIRDA